MKPPSDVRLLAERLVSGAQRGDVDEVARVLDRAIEIAATSGVVRAEREREAALDRLRIVTAEPRPRARRRSPR
jgi:hypothetical protein